MIQNGAIVLYEIMSGLAVMAFHCLSSFARRSIGTGVVLTFCLSPLLAQQSPGPAGQPTIASPAANSQQTTGPSSAGSSTNSDRLSESVFLMLDKNHDKVLTEAELNSAEALPYASKLKQADRDGNNRVTLEEFNQLGELPFYRDLRTVAVILLVLGLGAYCVFLDGLFDPEHSDYFWLSIGGMVVCVGLAFFVAKSWFLEQTPYLGYVAAAPVLLIVAAILFGATKEKEEATAAPTGPVVYQVGKKTGDTSAGAAKSQAPRKPPSPVRTPRPAPVPRPPVPDRRPQASPKPTPPNVVPPKPSTPTPPRPPSTRPPGGPKPPPGKP
jgi:hypothetical protein